MNYALKQFAEFVTYGDDGASGVVIECPNCGMKGSAWFENPIGGSMPVHRVTWKRTGETLETLTLHPSFAMIGHFHSWVRDGMLQVDSEFSCAPKRD